MRVLIVSDTHRQGENFYRALQETRPVSLVIHCGDVEEKEREFGKAGREANGCPLIMAAGSNDVFFKLKNNAEGQIGADEAHVSHGQS